MALPNRFYNPRAADIVGSLDTRQPGGRYGDVEAITPNVNITPQGQAKSDAVFAPLEGVATSVEDAHEAYVEETRLAENVTSIIDGSIEQSQTPVAGHRLLKDGIVESEPVAGEEGTFEPHTEETAEAAIDEHAETDGETETNSDGESSDDSGASSEAPGSTEPLPDGWKNQTNDDLHALASERGVETTSSMKKAELIAALQTWQDAR